MSCGVMLQCKWTVSGGAIYYFARILAVFSVLLCDMSYWWYHVAVQCGLFLGSVVCCWVI